MNQTLKVSYTSFVSGSFKYQKIFIIKRNFCSESKLFKLESENNNKLFLYFIFFDYNIYSVSIFSIVIVSYKFSILK